MTLTKNEITRESLGQAMAALLGQKSFHRITALELCETAGVSRNAYYRNYQSMEEVLKDHYLRGWQEFYPTRQDLGFSRAVVEYLFGYKDLIMKMEQHGSLYLWGEVFCALIDVEKLKTRDEMYQWCLQAYALYGLLVALTKDRFRSTPEEAWRFMTRQIPASDMMEKDKTGA